MSYPLRLPEALNAAARERAETLGISLNALVCVALDSYLGGVTRQAPAAPAQPPQPSPERKAHIERAKALGIPPGFEDVYDLDLYAESIGPDAIEPTEEELDALLGQPSAPLNRAERRKLQKGRKH